MQGHAKDVYRLKKWFESSCRRCSTIWTAIVALALRCFEQWKYDVKYNGFGEDFWDYEVIVCAVGQNAFPRSVLMA